MSRPPLFSLTPPGTPPILPPLKERYLSLVNKADSIKAHAAWVAVCFFWGTTYLAIRVGVRSIPPALFAGVRFTLAGLIFVAYLKLRGLAWPKAREFKNITVVGVALLVVANGLVVWAEQWVPSGLAAILIATLPFWMAGLEALVPAGSPLTARKVTGIIIGFLGLLLLFAPQLRSSFDGAYYQGILALLLAPLSWASGSIYSKYRPIQCHPLMAAGFQMLIAGLILLLIGAPALAFNRPAFAPEGLAALLYLIVFGSIVGYSSFVYALAKLPAVKVSTYAYVNPVIAVLLGWLVLDERLDWNVALATAVILFGIVLVKSSKT